MRDRTGWLRKAQGPVRIKNKTYKNLAEFSRPCGKCGEEFSIFVTPKIADGEADSNSFGLKNCAKHRRNGGPIEEQTTMENNTMRDELNGLYARQATLEAENKLLATKLATYELQPAMAVAAQQKKFPWN